MLEPIVPGPGYETESEETIMILDDVIKYGRERGGNDNLVNGMPWSFSLIPVTHENDDCYYVGGVRMERDDILLIHTTVVKRKKKE